MQDVNIVKYKLTIKPAIYIEHRHKIMDLLKTLGYNVYASGQYTDATECDIDFELQKND